jgi:L-arabinose isomerase
MGERFRIISNEISVVSPTEALPKLPVAHAVWEPKPSLPISAEAWMLAGGSHHTVLTNAVSLETLEDFTRIARVEHVIINEDTKMRDFRRELQWNAAYHRFAERI